MLDLVAFTKPVLDEITGQDVRTWHSGPSVLAANWQVPEFDSRIWRVRTLTIDARRSARPLSAAVHA